MSQSNDLGSQHEYVECQCVDPNHVFRMELDLYEKREDPELCLTMQMNPHPFFWRRLYHAFRYVFGMEVDYSFGGHWDSVVLDERAVDKMQSMMVAWSIVRRIRKVRRAKQLVKKMKP